MVNWQCTDFMNASWLAFQKDKKPALDIVDRFHDYNCEDNILLH